MTDTATDREENARRMARILEHHGTVVKSLQALANDIAAWTAATANDPSYKPAELATAYYHFKEIHALIDEEKKAVYKALDWLDKGLIPKRMEEHDVDQVRVPEIGRSFSVITRSSASFVDKEKGLQWLRDVGQGDLIQETVNAGTLAAFVRNMIDEQNIEPPTDVIKYSTYETTGMVKYNPKGKAR